jgi:hypothetical protein
MSQPPEHAKPQSRFLRAVRTAVAAIEESLYVIVGVLLLGAAVLVVVGTVSGLISSIRAHQSALNIGVVLLDRVLLIYLVRRSGQADDDREIEPPAVSPV